MTDKPTPAELAEWREDIGYVCHDCDIDYKFVRLLDYVAELEKELAMRPKMLGVRERAPMVIGEEAQHE